LPNIGKALDEKLKPVGVNSATELKLIGAEKAFIVDKDTCLNILCAIEGAIQEI